MNVVETIARERAAAVRSLKAARPEAELRRAASAPRPAFGKAFGKAPVPGFLLIAECKRASPSRGLLVSDYDPRRLALSYEAGGAGLISVLTEPRHFLGRNEHLVAVREAVALPVLRKDFIVDPWQIGEAWALGADAILLIASLHDAGALRELTALAHARSLSVLLEIHDEGELERAAEAGADAIGVNARDLRDFSVDGSRARALGAAIDTRNFKVAESGMKTPADAVALFRAGFRGFLVGEALATAADPAAATQSFASALGRAAVTPRAELAR